MVNYKTGAKHGQGRAYSTYSDQSMSCGGHGTSLKEIVELQRTRAIPVVVRDPGPRRTTEKHVYREPEQGLVGSGQREVGKACDKQGNRPKEIPGATENKRKTYSKETRAKENQRLWYPGFRTKENQHKACSMLRPETGDDGL